MDEPRVKTEYAKFVNKVVKGNVYEYDMKAANINILYHVMQRIPYDKYVELSFADKDTRVTEIGCMQRDNPGLGEEMATQTDRIVQEFLRANEIPEENIIDVVHDAIWLKDISCNITMVEGCTFRIKRRYDLLVIVHMKRQPWSLYIDLENNVIDYRHVPKVYIELLNTNNIMFILLALYYKNDNVTLFQQAQEYMRYLKQYKHDKILMFMQRLMDLLEV